MDYSDIRFPGLGIVLNHVARSIHIGNFEIMFYGILIATGFLCAYFVSVHEAKRTGQDPELYLDYLLVLVIPAIVGIRAYYVAFTWDYYKDHLLEIFNLRQGGLGVVGGVTAGVIVLLIFARVRKVSALLMMDTVSMGLLLAQIIGRWGNFFNREAFGGYTNGFTAMQIPVKYFEQMGRLTEIKNAGLLEHTVSIAVNGQTLQYISVHPTFLYEGMWNFLLLLFLLWYRKRKKFNGEMACIYFTGYSFGRFFIESLRVDQLQIGNTGIAATQVVCVVVFVCGLAALVLGRKHSQSIDKSEES